METSPFEEQIKSLLKTIMTKPFSATADIVETERQLKVIYQQNPTSLSVLIALLFCNLLQGKRDLALGLSNRIWREGGDLSDFFELVYADCLLNLGETEKAYSLIQPRLQAPQENLDYFYMVMVKYALMKGDLYLLVQFSGYPHVYEWESVLFDFAKKISLSPSAKSYKELLKIIYSTVSQSLCAFEYVLYDDGIELLFYTNGSVEQNNEWEHALSERTDIYFEENELDEIEGLSVRLLNISEHPAWTE